MRRTLWLALAAGLAFPQESALLGSKQALELYRRSVQLMESTAVAVPSLVRAGAPVIENARQAVGNLERASGQPGALTYSLLVNLRAYLALSDALPKPYPFPEEGRRQFIELREAAARLEAHFEALVAQKDAQLRSPDRDNLRRYAEANARLSPPAANKPRVVFLGDSITDGWRLNEYFPDRDFVNRGISGQITGEMLGRMKADVIDLQPAAVLILAGTNDIGRGVPQKTIQDNLEMITTLAVAHNIKPILASLLPVSDYHKDRNPGWEQTRRRPPESIRALNAWIAAFAKRKNFVFLDYYSALVDAKGLLKAEMADDGLHPNAAGYRIMAPLALAAIDKAIPPAAPPQQRRRRFPF